MVPPHHATAAFRTLKIYTCLVATWHPPNRWTQWVWEAALASLKEPGQRRTVGGHGEDSM